MLWGVFYAQPNGRAVGAKAVRQEPSLIDLAAAHLSLHAG
jgi:hypothetical protein